MDQAGDQVVWDRGGMGGVDVPHELVKVMSGILTSYPTRKQERQPSGLPNLTLSHQIPFHSPKRTLKLTIKRTPRRNKLHMQN